MNMETLHSLQRSHLEVDKITRLESQLSTLAVRMALLARLSGLQTVTDQVHLFFSLPEMIGSKDLAIAGFCPIQGCTAPTSIKSFNWCHLQTRLIAIVVGELGEG